LTFDDQTIFFLPNFVNFYYAILKEFSMKKLMHFSNFLLILFYVNSMIPAQTPNGHNPYPPIAQYIARDSGYDLTDSSSATYKPFACTVLIAQDSTQKCINSIKQTQSEDYLPTDSESLASSPSTTSNYSSVPHLRNCACANHTPSLRPQPPARVSQKVQPFPAPNAINADSSQSGPSLRRHLPSNYKVRTFVSTPGTLVYEQTPDENGRAILCPKTVPGDIIHNCFEKPTRAQQKPFPQPVAYIYPLTGGVTPVMCVYALQ
jgi:hypothetical protein